MLILDFFAIVSGAGLALAWYLVAPPVLARLAAQGRPLAARLSLGRVGRVLASRPVLALLLVLPFAAIAATLYLRGAELESDLRAAGQPGSAALDRARKEAPHDLDTAVTQLEARLAKDPNDADGWRLLERSYTVLGQTDKAADAARHAAALGAKSGDAASSSEAAEELVTAAGGTVTPEARRLFEAALAADPGDPRARFFVGLAQAQAGQGDDALTRWLALEADSPPDAPWRDGLHANIERLATEMGLSGDALAQRRAKFATASPAPAAAPAEATPVAGAPGPTASDVAAAAGMAPEDRSAMIKSMVQRLADRLEHEPGDVDGWLRLGRAYDVLGDKENSLDAYRRASQADPKRDDARAAYASALAARGVGK
jgi:cytochrome c-type biogenesis protein CcmH